MPNEFLWTLIAFPVWMIVWVTAGFFTYFSTPLFSLLLSLPLFTLVIIAVILWRQKTHKPSYWAAFTAALGSWMGVLMWTFSGRTIDPAESTHTWAMNSPSAGVRGFPFQTLETPLGALGSNRVPVDMWPDLLLNNLFWFGVAFLVALVFTNRLPEKVQRSKTLLIFLFVIGALGVFANIGQMALFFE